MQNKVAFKLTWETTGSRFPFKSIFPSSPNLFQVTSVIMHGFKLTSNSVTSLVGSDLLVYDLKWEETFILVGCFLKLISKDLILLQNRS